MEEWESLLGRVKVSSDCHCMGQLVYDAYDCLCLIVTTG